MRRRNIARIAMACIAFTLMLAGCRNADRRYKFIGTWHRVPFPKETLTVTKEGAKRLVFVAHGYISPEPQIGEIVGDQVVINPLLTVVLRENGNMMYGSQEYIR